jgi:hypothetical protein
MICSFRSFHFLVLLLSIHTIFAFISTPQRRSRSRAHYDTTLDKRSLERRAAPSGWSLYVKSGNDGGGCYMDTQPRVLSGYTYSSSVLGLESCLNACKTKGFSYGGVQNGDQCYVSLAYYLRVNTDRKVRKHTPFQSRICPLESM